MKNTLFSLYLYYFLCISLNFFLIMLMCLIFLFFLVFLFMYGIAVQDLTTLDPSRLTALTPEVISRQATINIGTIGHVAHGKSTVVKAISGVKTIRFKNELIRNITIKLGYANAKIYR